MVEALSVTKCYGRFRAVADVSFVARRGEILGLLGPNGAGKTTTLRVLAGFMPPTAGTVNIDGFDVLKEPREVRRRVGYLPENPPLYDEMTVRAYLRFVAGIRGVPSRELPTTAEEALEKCRLAEVADRLIDHLAKGYRQRVGLAQALIHNPSALILDEPTLGLDPMQIIEIRSLIRELARDRTVILSTHILPEVTQICTKVVILNDGRVTAQGELKALTEGASLEEVFLRSVSKEVEEQPTMEPQPS